MGSDKASRSNNDDDSSFGLLPGDDESSDDDDGEESEDEEDTDGDCSDRVLLILRKDGTFILLACLLCRLVIFKSTFEIQSWIKTSRLLQA